MSETKFGGKNEAHSEKILLASEIFPSLAKITASEICLIFFLIFFF